MFRICGLSSKNHCKRLFLEFHMSSEFLGKRKALNRPQLSKVASKKRKLHLSSAGMLPSQSLGSTNDDDVNKAGPALHLPVPVKSENDKKTYRSIQLSNGMKILLILDPHVHDGDADIHPVQGIENLGYNSDGEDDKSDAEHESDEDDECEEETDEEECSSQEDDDVSEEEPNSHEERILKNHGPSSKEGERMAAASLCVSVGSFSDPPDLPGLAHFLEHMVFMGSDKYPQENALDEFVKTYGGSTNASTDYEYTTFEFEIHQRYFKDALKVFAQFFASPLLRPESMKREKEAIDSEFRMALPSDSCRKQQLFAGLAKKGHPMSVFSWGNSTTLSLPEDPSGIELNRRLRTFWEDHYTADRMTLVLQSKHDLDVMEDWAKSIFQEIPSRNPSVRPCFDSFGSPFDTPQFNRILQVIPVKNVNQVSLSWALPSQLHHYRTKPLAYLSWLIGHEGKGSLLAYLRHKIWALDLTSGNDESGFEHNSTYALFSVNINLTQNGMDQIEQVICAVFQYIAMLKECGPDAQLWKEIQRIEDMAFRYIEDVPPVDYVESLGENMHKYPPAEYITGDSLLMEYNDQVIADCTKALRPDKVNIMIVSKQFASQNVCNEVEPWFKTQYGVKDIPDEWMKMWFAAQPGPFKLPEANPFLASDFTILESFDERTKTHLPILISRPDDEFSLWYRKDNQFLVPKAILSFYMVAPFVTESPRNLVMLDLLANLLKQQMMEDAYDALVAQLEFTIHSYDRGLVIKVSGFNHKLHLLMGVIVDHLKKFDQYLRTEVFDALKEEQKKTYRNFSLKPAKLVTEARLTLLHTSHWSVIEKYHAVDGIQLEDIKEFANKLKDTSYLECLVQGNYSIEQALEVVGNLKNNLQPDKRDRIPLPPIRICEVPIGRKYCRIASFHKTDPNSVVVNYYQTGPTNIRQMAIMEILVNLMEEPVFDVLRTQEQLGYNVYVTLRNTFGVLGFSVTVDFQMNKFSPAHVDERIEHFLSHFEQRLSEMNETELGTRITSLIKLKQRPDVSLDEEVSRNWNEILTEEYLFDRLDKEVEHLRKIQLEDVRAFYRRFAVCGDKSERRKLSMQVVGRDERDEPVSTAEDYSEQMGLRFLPDMERADQFITDLTLFRKSSSIYPPLKTYNGLPDSE